MTEVVETPQGRDDLQQIGVDALCESSRFLLADTVGIGKTFQGIKASRIVAYDHILWVTGAQPSFQVLDECRTHAPGCTVKVARGTRQFREAVYSDPPHYTIISYDALRSDIETLIRMPWKCVILDDANYFKTPDTKATIAANRLCRDRPYAWALTGTPIQTGLPDLWSVFHAIDLHPLGSLDDVYRNYCVWGWKHVGDKNERAITGYRSLDRVKELIKPYMLRRTSVEGRPDLQIVDFRIGLYPRQAELYRQVVTSPADVLTRFRLSLQLCDSTAFLPRERNPESSKLDFILSYLKAREGKVVIYTMWLVPLRQLKDMLDRACIRYVEISGDVPIPIRNDNQKAFHRDPDVRVCLVTKAAECALNLQAAQTLICLNRLANPKRMEQVYGRIRRIGSAFKTIYIVNLIIEGSVEERMLQLYDQREALSDGVLDDVPIKRLSVSDMAGLLAGDHVRVDRAVSVKGV